MKYLAFRAYMLGFEATQIFQIFHQKLHPTTQEKSSFLLQMLSGPFPLITHYYKTLGKLAILGTFRVTIKNCRWESKFYKIPKTLKNLIQSHARVFWEHFWGFGDTQHIIVTQHTKQMNCTTCFCSKYELVATFRLGRAVYIAQILVAFPKPP